MIRIGHATYMANDGGLASVVNLCRWPQPGGKAHEISAMGRRASRHGSMAMARQMLAEVTRGTPSMARMLNEVMEKYLMNRPRSFRLALVALVPVAAVSLGIATALAQSPAPPAASTPAPASPAIPAPAPSASPTPSASPAPSASQTPSPSPTPAPPATAA